MRTHEPGKAPDGGESHRPVSPAGRTLATDLSAEAPPLSPMALLALQRSAGNAAVVQMLRQAGHPGAEQHQHGDGCGHRAAQAPVQRSTVPDVLRSGGRPLDEATRTDMESRLGADFSNVRLHTGATAQRSAAEVGARAYTSGNHIVVGAGGSDRHTLAHELTHVIQQRQGPVSGTDNGRGLKVSDPSDRFEREAEANASRVLSRPAASTSAHATDSSATPASASGGPAAGPPVQRLVSAGGQQYDDVDALLAAAAAAGVSTVNFGQGWLRDLLMPVVNSTVTYTFAQGTAADALRWVALRAVVEDLYHHLSRQIDADAAEEAGQAVPAAEAGAPVVGGPNAWSYQAKLAVLRSEQARFATVGRSSPGGEPHQRRPFTILGRTYAVGNQGTNHYYVFPPDGGMHTYAGGEEGLRKNTAVPIVEALIHGANTQQAPAGQPISPRDLDEFVFAFLAEPTRWNPEHFFNVLALEKQPNPALPGGSPRITGGGATIPLPMAAGGTFNPGAGPDGLGELADRVPDRAVTVARRLGLVGPLDTFLGRAGITRPQLTRLMGRGLGIME